MVIELVGGPRCGERIEMGGAVPPPRVLISVPPKMTEIVEEWRPKDEPMRRVLVYEHIEGIMYAFRGVK